MCDNPELKKYLQQKMKLIKTYLDLRDAGEKVRISKFAPKFGFFPATVYQWRKKYNLDNPKVTWAELSQTIRSNIKYSKKPKVLGVKAYEAAAKKEVARLVENHNLTIGELNQLREKYGYGVKTLRRWAKAHKEKMGGEPCYHEGTPEKALREWMLRTPSTPHKVIARILNTTESKIRRVYEGDESCILDCNMYELADLIGCSVNQMQVRL